MLFYHWWNFGSKEVDAVRTALLKWRHSLPWVLFACLVLGCVMAVYTWAYEADRYEAVYTFYAMPDLAGTQRAPLEASRMLARDCRTLTRAESFRQAVLAQAESDGRSRVGVRGVDGTHMLEVLVIGPDRELVAGLADAIGRELVLRAPEDLGAVEAHEITPASVPGAPCAPNRPLKVLWTMLAVFAAGSLLGAFLGSARQPVRYPDAAGLAVPALGAVADCRREARRLVAGGEKRRGMLLDQVDRFIRENVRSFALRLRNALCANGQSVAVLAGMTREDDQAVLSALLCGELARQGFRVLAVEMDMERAMLAPLLGARPRACLTEYFDGQAGLTDVMTKTPEPNLCFISGLAAGVEVAQVAATAAFQGFVKSARSRFDFIIINAASVENCADAGMLGASESLTVLTARDGRFTAGELNAAAASLAEEVRMLRGVAFTMARRERFDRFD